MLFQNRLTVSHNYPKILTHTPSPSSGQKWSALKRRNCALLWISQFKIWCRRLKANGDCVAEQIQFRLAWNAFPDIESVGRIEKKKKTKKKSQEVSE